MANAPVASSVPTARGFSVATFVVVFVLFTALNASSVPSLVVAR